MESTIERDIWVANGTRESEDREAKKTVARIRDCFSLFSRSVKIERLVRRTSKQPDLFDKE
jgi:hypothetical protein